MKKKVLIISTICTFGLLASVLGNTYIKQSVQAYNPDQTWWENNCELPEGYTSLEEIVTNGVKNTIYTTRGTITGFDGKSPFIQSRGYGIELYTKENLGFSLGQVIDVTGSFTTYYNVPELQNLSSSTLYAETNPCPVEPLVININNYEEKLVNANLGKYVQIDDLLFDSANGANVTFKIGDSTVIGRSDSSVSGLSNQVTSFINEQDEGTYFSCKAVLSSSKNNPFELKIHYLEQLTAQDPSGPVLVRKICVSPSLSTIYADETQTFSASVSPAVAEDKSVTWSVNNGGTITSEGVFTPNGVGTYIITATSNDGSNVSSYCTIDVIERPTYIVGTVVENPTLSNGVLGPLYVPGSGEPFKVSFLEMHGSYGDAILFDYGDFEMIIDGGAVEDAPYTMAALGAACDDGQIELMINTHPHVDHFGGISQLALYEEAGIESIKYLVEFGGVHSTVNIENWYETRDYFINKGTTRYTNYEMIHNEESGYPNVINITDDITITFMDTQHYVPLGEQTTDENESSIALVLSIGNTRYILTGDCTNEQVGDLPGSEQCLINNYAGTGLWTEDTVNIVKANHHGSQTHGSNSQEWANATLPDYVIFSAAIIPENRTSYGFVRNNHPYKSSIVKYLNALETGNAYWNGINGTISFTHLTIDSNPTISFAGRTIDYYDSRTNTLVDRELEKTISIQQSVYYQCL